MINLLHITDLHFSNEASLEDIQAAWKIIYDSLGKIQKETPLDGVVITGDFTLHGSKDEFEMANEYLGRLGKMLSMPRERFFFCEGNHDADTTKMYSTYQHYKEFVLEFLGEKPRKFLKTEEGTYGILTVHTCTETSWEEYNHGVLLPYEVDWVTEECEHYGKIIVVMHHQPEVIENVSLLEKWQGKVDLILTGHKHPNQATDYYYKGIEVENGMAVTPHLPEILRGYQVLRIEQASVKEIIPYPIQL